MSQNRGQYTFGQLVTVVEDLKIVVENLKKEFELYKSKIDNRIGSFEKHSSSESFIEAPQIKVESSEHVLDSYTEEEMTEVGSRKVQKSQEPENSFQVQRDLLKIEKDLLESSFVESKSIGKNPKTHKPKSKSKDDSTIYPIVKYEEESEQNVKLEPVAESESCKKLSYPPPKRKSISNVKKEELKSNTRMTENSCTEKKRKSHRKRKNILRNKFKYKDFDMSGSSEDDEDIETDDEEDEVKPKKPAKLYCKCKCPDSKDDMIACDGPCQDWYHFECVGIPDNFRSIAMWYCEDCFLKETDGCVEVFLKVSPLYILLIFST